MGLLSRFRTPSTSSASPKPSPTTPAVPTAPHSAPQASASHHEPTTPTPVPGAASTLKPSHLKVPLSEPPARTSIPPTSPSTSSITSRISRKPWKRGKSHQPPPAQPKSPADAQPQSLAREPTTPVGSVKGKSKWKGKGKEDDIGGLSYEKMSPPRIPSSTRTVSAPVTPRSNPHRITMFHLGQGVPSSPLRMPTSPISVKGDIFSPNDDSPLVNSARPASGHFTQDGGVLGRLGFETSQTVLEDNDVWLDASSVGHDVLIPTASGSADASATMSEVGETPVIVDRAELPMDGEAEAEASAVDEGEDGMEMIESPEKKTKFWKGKGRARRASKAASEHADIERSGSPTPRKPSASAAPSDLTEGQPQRPQQLRRPSSSLFHNPFTRSVSRASLALDLDRSPVDDGSFQLRGFRHVSGMSDVEGAGGLEGYLSHVKKDSTVLLPLDKEKEKNMSSPMSTNPPSSFPLPRPRIQSNTYSRPPSVAGSLASVDDLMASTSKVSVAAFRKGIRRPSEVFGTMSDLGHGGYSRDEEDDLPLGALVMNRPDEAKSREKSTTSLSSMRGSEIALPDRQASPSPALSFTVQRHQRGASSGSGFLVKSARYTRPDELLRAASGTTDGSRPTSFATPPTTSPPSPSIAEAERQLSSSPEAMDSHSILTPVDSYFSKTAPAFSQNPIRMPAPSSGLISLDQLKPKPDFGEGAFPSPPNTARKTPSPIPTTVSDAEESSPRRAPPPPVEPIRLPEPGDKTPGSLHLPLPPDQMPNTPPKAPMPLHELPQRTPFISTPGSSAPNTGTTSRKRLSLLDEPMRILSGFWASQPEDDLAFDPALLAREGSVPPDLPPKDHVQDRSLQHQPSRSTLFDLRTATPVPNHQRSSSPAPVHVIVPSSAPDESGDREQIRSPLSERLANVAISSLTKPSLSRLKTAELSESGVGVQGIGSVMSPGHTSGASGTSETATSTARNSPVVESASTLVSSFARAKRVTRSQSQESSDDGSEDSRDEREMDEEVRRRFQHAQLRAALSSSTSGTADARAEGATSSDQPSGGRRISATGSSRRVPGGPRKPSVRNRITSSGSISALASQPPQYASSSHPAHVHPAESETIQSSDDDDEPLAIVKKKASRSSLFSSFSSARTTTSPPIYTNGLPSPSMTSTSASTASLSLSPPARARKTLVEIGPVSQPLRDQSQDDSRSRSRSQSASRQRAMSTSSTAARSPPPIPTRSPKRGSKPLPLSEGDHGHNTAIRGSGTSENRTNGAMTMTASPASSISGTGTTNTTNTGESMQRLTTPRESLSLDRPAAGPTTKSRDAPRQLSQSSHQPHPSLPAWSPSPSPYDQQYMPMPLPMPLPMPIGIPPFPMAMPMQMDPAMGQMDPAAMHAYMKQRWQMQYMAAAYRASEEEWERASSVSGFSGRDDPSLGHGQGQQRHAPPPMPMAMGYPYGYPQQPFFPPSFEFGPTSPQLNGGPGGMCSYNPGSQSVFGTDFGPPRAFTGAHSSHKRTTSTSGANSALGLHESSPRKVGGGNSNSERDTNVPSPPSTWRRSSTGLAGWQGQGPGAREGEETPRKNNRAQSTLIN